MGDKYCPGNKVGRDQCPRLALREVGEDQTLTGRDSIVGEGSSPVGTHGTCRRERRGEGQVDEPPMPFAQGNYRCLRGGNRKCAEERPSRAV